MISNIKTTSNNHVIYSVLVYTEYNGDSEDCITGIETERTGYDSLKYVKNEGNCYTTVRILFDPAGNPTINHDIGQIRIGQKEMLDSLRSVGVGRSWLYNYYTIVYGQYMMSDRKIAILYNSTGRDFYMSYMTPTSKVVEKIGTFDPKMIMTRKEQYILGGEFEEDKTVIFVEMVKRDECIEKTYYVLSFNEPEEVNDVIITSSFINISTSAEVEDYKLSIEFMRRKFLENAIEVVNINEMIANSERVKQTIKDSSETVANYGVKLGFMAISKGKFKPETLAIIMNYIKPAVEKVVSMIFSAVHRYESG